VIGILLLLVIAYLLYDRRIATRNPAPTGRSQAMQVNPGSYFEIPVADLDRAIRFYSAVFGCEFSRETIHGNEMAMFPSHPDRPGIPGALSKGEIYVPSKTGSLIYLNVESIDQALERVVAVGGSVLFPRTKAGEYGLVAEFEDSEGNRVALFQALGPSEGG
jgi:predicted enzyme related to lactoylglutathione lyase